MTKQELATKMQEFGVLPEIEIFDLSHLHGALRLTQAGLMNDRPHVQFVMGVKNAMPAEEGLMEILLAETRRILPGATWTAGVLPGLPFGFPLPLPASAVPGTSRVAAAATARS